MEATTTDKQIILKTPKANLVLRVVLLVIFLGTVAAPLIFIGSQLKGRQDVSAGAMGFALGMLILAVYWLRLILWNSGGREILTLKAHQLEYVADYGLFKDGHTSLPAAHLEVEPLQIGAAEQQLARVVLRAQNEEVISAIKAPVEDVKRTCAEIRAHYLTLKQQS